VIGDRPAALARGVREVLKQRGEPRLSGLVWPIGLDEHRLGPVVAATVVDERRQPQPGTTLAMDPYDRIFARFFDRFIAQLVVTIAGVSCVTALAIDGLAVWRLIVIALIFVAAFGVLSIR
jgi:hypothetical protein